jgi:hypothetical protein
MPDSPLSISISNSQARPNGNGATLSISANGNPSEATWTARDRDYDISLPASVWEPPAGSELDFSLSQGATSGVYSLKPNAPLGVQSYSIEPALGGDDPPKVVVEP